MPKLIDKINQPIATILADGAYDQPSTYQAMTEHQKHFESGIGITAAIPPNLGFREEMAEDHKSRVDNIRVIEQGRERWQKHTNYGRRAKVENSMYRYKIIIGNKLKSRSFLSQDTESKIAINILNTMTINGMPCSQKCA